MTNKPRHVDFYPAEWIAGTIGLTAEERGVYITLCAVFYRDGERPVSVDRLLSYCRPMKARAIERILPRLISYGNITDENGAFGMVPVEERRGLLPAGYPAYPEDTVRRSRYISPSIKDAVWSASDGLCSYCGVSLNRDTHNRDPRQFTVDHFLAVAFGGGEDADNLVAACRSCNSSKGKLAGDLFTSKLGGTQ